MDLRNGHLALFLPHINELASRRPRVITATEIQDEWRRNVRAMRKGWTPTENERFDAQDDEVKQIRAEKARFDHLDDEIKAMLIDGSLNPWDVYFALKQPDYLDFTLHPECSEVRTAIDVMASHLARIKAGAAGTGTRVQVVSVPAGCYTCVRGLSSRRKVGYRLDESALHSDAPDEVIRSACRTVGLGFHSFTARFREAGADRQLYFEFDGHFNRDGHALFAEQVVALLEDVSDSASAASLEGDGLSRR